MNLKIFVILIVVFLSTQPIFSVTVLDSDLDNFPVVSTPVDSKVEEIEVKKKQNINIDSRLMYGQNNNILSSFSLTQSYDTFIYQLNGTFKRSNDFGEKNSSFLESEIEFAAEKEITEFFKIMPEVEVNNESHGMFSNSKYGREEQDRVIFKIKSEYKPTPTKWNFDVVVGQYVHRLIKTGGNGVEKHDFEKNQLNFDWENIMSGSNRFKYNIFIDQYFYGSGNEQNDTHVENEIAAGVKITKYIKILLAAGGGWNRDIGLFYTGKSSVSTVSLKKVNLELNYAYDTVPFEPEIYYFGKKYVLPNFNLLPGKKHNINLKGEFNLKDDKESFFQKIVLKGVGEFERDKNRYNFYTTSDDVLSSDSMLVTLYSFKTEIVTTNKLAFGKFETAIGYNYKYFDSLKNVTYEPSQIFKIGMKYVSKTWELKWENKYSGEINISPESEDKLDHTFLGALSFQKQLYESFYFHFKIDNLYDDSYSLQLGYPEPGVTILTGLRIIL